MVNDLFREYVSKNMQNILNRRAQTYRLPEGYKRNLKTGKIYISKTDNVSKSKKCPECPPCIKNFNDEFPNYGRPPGCPKCLPCTPSGRRITLTLNARKRKAKKSRKTRKN
jgi:hypothetical protein